MATGNPEDFSMHFTEFSCIPRGSFEEILLAGTSAQGA